MEQKAAIFQNKGMSRDASISKVNNEFAYENFNVRITPRNHDSLLSVTNEKGNTSISFNHTDITTIDVSVDIYADGEVYISKEFDIPIKIDIITINDDVHSIVLLSGNNKTNNIVYNGLAENIKDIRISGKYDYNINMIITYNDNNDNAITFESKYAVDNIFPGYLLGYAVINNNIIMFFHASEDDYIYRVYHENNSWYSTILFRGDLNFDADHPIETLVDYESEDVQKIYWVDGLNQPRMINIKKSYESFYNNTVFDFITNTDFLLDNSFSVEKEFKGIGNFSPGKIKYAITLSNKFGQETNIIYVSPYYYISDKDKGNNSDETVTCSFNISFKIEPKYKFDYINLYAIHFTGSTFSAYKKTIDFKSDGFYINIIDTGVYDSSISPDILLYIGGKEIVADTLCSKDSTLFLGNLSLKGTNIIKSLKDKISNYIDENGESHLINFDYSKNFGIPVSDDSIVYPYINQLNYSEDDIKIYKAGEKYRFGLVFITNTGQRSSVYWIGDKTNYLHVKNDISEYDSKKIIEKPIPICTIPEDVCQEAINNGYTRVVLVRAVPTSNDRTVIAQGIVNPTIFNLLQRYNNAAYGMSSWFFRPCSEQTASEMFSPIANNNSKFGEIQSLFPNIIIPDSTKPNETIEIPYTPYFNLQNVDFKIAIRRKIALSATYSFNRSSSLLRIRINLYQTNFSSDSDTSVIGGYNEWVTSNDIKLYSFTHKFETIKQRIKESISNLKATRYTDIPNYVWDTIEKNEESINLLTFYITDTGNALPSNMRDTKLVEFAEYNINGISNNTYQQYCKANSHTYFIDSSLFTFHTPESVYDLKGLEFRIVGVVPLDNEQISWNLNFDKESYSDKSPIKNNTFIKNVGDIKSYYTIPCFQYLPGIQDNKIDTGILTYPWHKTGALVPGFNLKLNSKIMSWFRFSNRSYYLPYNNYWSPTEIIEDVAYTGNDDSKIIKVDKNFVLYYSNYDYIQLQGNKVDSSKNIVPENYKVYNTGKNTIDSEYHTLEDERTWASADEKVDSPIQISAKSSPHFIASIKRDPLNNAIRTLPKQSVDKNIYLFNNVLPWKKIVNNDTSYIITGQNINTFYWEVDNNYNFYFGSVIQELLTKLNSALEYKNSMNDPQDYFMLLKQNEVYKVINAPRSITLNDALSPQLYITSDFYVDSATYSIRVSTKKIEPSYQNIYKHSEKDTYQYGTKVYQHSVIKILDMYGNTTKSYTIVNADSLKNDFFVQSIDIGIVVNAAHRITFEVYSAYNSMDNNDYTTFSESIVQNKYLVFQGDIFIPRFSVEDIHDEYNTEEQTSFKYNIDQTNLEIVTPNGIYLGYDCPSIKFTGGEFEFYSDYGVYCTSDHLPIWPYNDKHNIPREGLLSSTTPFLYIGEFYKKIDPITDMRYGGISEFSVLLNSFIDAGKSEELQPTGIELIGPRGDWYYQRYDCLKTMPYEETKENSIIDIVSCMLETTINLDGRTDKQRIMSDYTLISPDSYNVINNVYSGDTNPFISTALDSDKFTEDKFYNQITWTKPKILNSDTDVWTNITLAGIENLDGDKGKIRAIKRFNNSLIAFQDKGIAEILFNSRTPLSTTAGIPVELANSGKVDGKRYISNKDGCVNKWSILETKAGIYFIDNLNSSISLYNGESIKSLSDEKGFKNWIGQHNSIELWTPKNFNNFIVYQDKTNDDVYFIKKDKSDKYNTICYNELLGQFTSFFNYGDVPMMVNVKDKFISFRDNKLWEQWTGDYNNIFGEQQDFHMLYRIAPDPYGDKIFTSLEYRADMFDMNNINQDSYMPKEGTLTNNTFDVLEVWNEYQGNKVAINETTSPLYSFGIKDKYPDIRRKFRIWRMDIPRDKKGPDNPHGLNRIRNPWIYLKLSKTNSLPNERMEFHDLVVKYFE